MQYLVDTWSRIRNHFSSMTCVRLVALVAFVLDILFDLESRVLEASASAGTFELLRWLSHADMALAGFFLLAPERWLRPLSLDPVTHGVRSWITRSAFLCLGALVSIEYSTAYSLLGGMSGMYVQSSALSFVAVEAQGGVLLGMATGIVLGMVVLLWIILVSILSYCDARPVSLEG